MFEKIFFEIVWLILFIKCFVSMKEVVNLVVYVVSLLLLVIMGVVLCVDGGVVKLVF